MNTPGTSVSDPSLLGAALVAAINDGDVAGVIALYEPDAVLELPDGTQARGTDQIRAFFADLIAGRPRFEPGMTLPALMLGDLALTTTRLGSSATAEVARRQPDGSWRWILDRPDVLVDRNRPGPPEEEPPGTAAAGRR